MSELAAQLVDRVLPHVPIRQWVFTVPVPVRYQLAFDDREPAPAQDGAGSAGDREAAARLRPHEAGRPGGRGRLPGRRLGRPDLAGRPPPHRRWR